MLTPLSSHLHTVAEAETSYSTAIEHEYRDAEYEYCDAAYEYHRKPEPWRAHKHSMGRLQMKTSLAVLGDASRFVKPTDL
jgi:hypothetical protein